MRRLGLVLVGMVGMTTATGCPADDEPCTGPVSLTTMTYNVANQTGDNGDNIAAEIAGVAPDVVAAQECGSCDYLLERLPERYQLTAAPRAGVAILYDSSVWEVGGQGVIVLGENDDGWGERVARWARLTELATGDCLLFYATHFCVPVRSPDDACDVDRQLEYAARIARDVEARADPDTPVVLAGDFNVFDGFETGPVVTSLIDGGWVDVYRVADPAGDGTTFVGSDWAPAGRIDYLWATAPVTVVDAAIDRDSIPDGAGSDHYPVIAELELGGE